MSKLKDWLDKAPRGFDCRRGYYFAHPFTFFRECGRQIRWAWQRVFRGWDDRVIWSIDYYLAEKLPEWIGTLVSINCGTSTMFLPEGANHFSNDDAIWDEANKKQIETFNKIIDGFKTYAKLSSYEYESEEEREEMFKKFDEGMALFVKYYGTLWW